jgi:AbrB family looped-hinge helix DNA binding protein
LRNGTHDGICFAITATISIDAAGRLILPKAMRDRLHLSAGTRLKADIVADKIELTPVPDANVRIERRGKRLVIVGGPPFDDDAAIKADREARDETIARRVRGK